MDENGAPEFINAFYHYGLEWEVLPSVIFLGLGTLTDFGPLIANPKVLAVGAGAQLGVFVTFLGTLLCGFTLKEAASVGIIGGADGPTTVYLTTALAPHLLGANAVAAYSYMALVPLIQPPVMRLLTTPESAASSWSSSPGVEAGENGLPPHRGRGHRHAHPRRDAADGHVHARQLHARVRRGAPPGRHGRRTR